MKRVLADIQSGKFARDWMLENKVNQTSFKATRAKLAQHPIEEVGIKLRDMMPLIKKARWWIRRRIRGEGSLPARAGRRPALGLVAPHLSGRRKECSWMRSTPTLCQATVRGGGHFALVEEISVEVRDVEITHLETDIGD